MQSFSPLSTFCALLVWLSTAIHTVSWPIPLKDYSLENRSANTCADPSLADSLIQAYVVDGMAHIVDFRWGYIATNAMGTDWQLQAESFRAWDTPQTFTVPLFRLVSTGASLDFKYAMGTGSVTPPVAPPGWAVNGDPFAWVYETQTCGSVPLMAVANSAATDHWFTTDQKERDNLVASGWVDEGIVAFVLPLQGFIQ